MEFLGQCGDHKGVDVIMWLLHIPRVRECEFEEGAWEGGREGGMDGGMDGGMEGGKEGERK